MDTLKIQASSFIQLCHSTEGRMTQILLEAELTAARSRGVQKDRENVLIIGAVAAAAAAVLSLLAASVTGGLSITVFGIAAVAGSIIAPFVILILKLVELDYTFKMSKLITDFSLLAEPLQYSLERVKSSCESLCSKSPEGEALKFTRLEVNILQIFNIIEKLRNSSSGMGVIQQAEEVKKVVEEIRRMKTDLKTFY